MSHYISLVAYSITLAKKAMIKPEYWLFNYQKLSFLQKLERNWMKIFLSKMLFHDK